MAQSTKLRPYQNEALKEIRKLYSKGKKKVLLWLATGAGKTVVFSEILKSLYDKRKNAIMVVRGRKLIQQAHERLIREGVPHGVLMANHSFYRPFERIQLCSIDTIKSRRLKPRADLIVVDEAHLLTSKADVEFFASYPDAFFLPVTATPFGTRSLRHFADEIVSPVSIKQLIEEKFLVDGRYYAPNEPDLTGVKIDSKTKDYNQRELGETMDKLKLVGNIVEEWKKYGQERPTVCFAVTVKHSEHIAEEFNRAGIPAIHCDASSPDDFRERTISRLRDGNIKIITNVGLFGIGVDMPFLSCIVLARPTQSLNLYLQQMGRGLRPYSGKQDCLFLDHAGNILRHGFPTDFREPSLDGKTKRKAVTAVRCKECFAVVAELPCRYCGWTKPELEGGGGRNIEHVEGSLSELKPKEYVEATASEIRKDIQQWDARSAEYGFKLGWIWHQCKTKYGPEVAKFYLADRFRR